MTTVVRRHLSIEMRFEAVPRSIAEQPQALVEAGWFAEAARCRPSGHCRAAAAGEERLPQALRETQDRARLPIGSGVGSVVPRPRPSSRPRCRRLA